MEQRLCSQEEFECSGAVPSLYERADRAQNSWFWEVLYDCIEMQAMTNVVHSSKFGLKTLVEALCRCYGGVDGAPLANLLLNYSNCSRFIWADHPPFYSHATRSPCLPWGVPSLSCLAPGMVWHQRIRSAVRSKVLAVWPRQKPKLGFWFFWKTWLEHAWTSLHIWSIHVLGPMPWRERKSGSMV